MNRWLPERRGKRDERNRKGKVRGTNFSCKINESGMKCSVGCRVNSYVVTLCGGRWQVDVRWCAYLKHTEILNLYVV